MKIIVDANIVFSGILNSEGTIGDILINSQNYFQFIAPYFLQTEISRLYPRLSTISGLSVEQVQEAEFQVCRNIIFISEKQIEAASWIYAEKLAADIDPKDTHYIAYSNHFKCKIWSGDKVLINGLAKKGWIDFFTTQQLFKLREEFRKQQIL